MPDRPDNTSAQATASTGTDLHQTTQRISQMAHDAVDRITAQVESAEERLRAATGNAETKLAQSRDRMRLESEKLTDNLSTYVQKHPLAAVGIAFGAGVLVAALLRRD
jgi:ElaB/YqjD/DUF883 family membrane-anchored ribosome-binding protein